MRQPRNDPAPADVPPANEVGVLAALRALLPARGVSLDQAEAIAERQADLLRVLTGVHGPRTPDSVITGLPRVRVVEEPDSPVSATTVWSSGTWLIILSGDEPGDRQRFSLMHEFKHIIDYPAREQLYGDGTWRPMKAEHAADHFAGALLMPKAELLPLIEEGVNPAALSYIFNVSTRAIETRLHQLGIGVTGPCHEGLSLASRGRYYRRTPAPLPPSTALCPRPTVMSHTGEAA